MYEKKLEKKKKEITDYSFVSFSNTDSDVKPNVISKYDFSPLGETLESKKVKNQEMINLVLENSKKNNFEILPIIKEHKGFKEKEYKEKEEKISKEVEKRIKLIKDEAVKQGYEEGVKLGKTEVFDQTRIVVEEKLENLSNMINKVLTTQEDLLNNQKKQIYYLIRNLTQWVILKELKNDGDYLKRLLDKLIVEMHARKNLFIQVNKNDFDRMPEILEIIQKRMGKLENVRVEVDYEISENGIVLECDNGIINGTFEEQFKSLDRLFESVGVDEKFFNQMESIPVKENNDKEADDSGQDE